MISVNYGFGGGVVTPTNVKSSAKSDKFTLTIKSVSGKLSTVGCHFPLKSTNFGTLVLWVELKQILHLKVGCLDFSSVWDRGSLLHHPFSTQSTLRMNQPALTGLR